MSRRLLPSVLFALLTGLLVFSAGPTTATASFFDIFNMAPEPTLVSVTGLPVQYANGAMMRNVRMTHPSQRTARPEPGTAPGFINSFFDVFTELSTDGGQTWVPRESPTTPFSEMVQPPNGSGGTQFYDTEMLSLNLSGGSFMIRESPSKQSLGKDTVQPDPGGTGYQVDSFFDVFTELSLDGGQTWSPQGTNSPQPLRLTGTPEPATLTMLGAGGLLLLFYAWRRKRAG